MALYVLIELKVLWIWESLLWFKWCWGGKTRYTGGGHQRWLTLGGPGWHKQDTRTCIINKHHYFIKRRVRKEQVTASKPFERGYHIYDDARKVQSIAIYSPTDDIFRVIRTDVHPSQKTDRVYCTFIVAYKTSGEIYHATCSCTAGGGSCNHVAALSFAIDDYNI